MFYQIFKPLGETLSARFYGAKALLRVRQRLFSTARFSRIILSVTRWSGCKPLYKLIESIDQIKTRLIRLQHDTAGRWRRCEARLNETGQLLGSFRVSSGEIGVGCSRSFAPSPVLVAPTAILRQIRNVCAKKKWLAATTTKRARRVLQLGEEEVDAGQQSSSLPDLQQLQLVYGQLCETITASGVSRPCRPP